MSVAENAGAQSDPLEAIHKIPLDRRYFNISTKWIPYYPLVIRLFYFAKIRHEVATALSIVAGIAGAWMIASLPESQMFVAAALAVHLKDVFDATDGALARVTGTGHRLGRFVDTVGDGVVFTAWIAATAAVMVKTGSTPAAAAAWAAAGWLALFLQCSYFNFYQLHYIRRSGASSASNLDERSDPVVGSSAAARTTKVLARIYDAWFGWQDRAIAALDRMQRTKIGLPPDPAREENDRWFEAKGFMVANSALCFGTHAFVLVALLLLGRPELFLPVVSVGMSLYLVVIASARQLWLRSWGTGEVAR